MENLTQQKKGENDSAYSAVSKHFSDLCVQQMSQWQAQPGSIRLIMRSSYSRGMAQERK